jgi:hypothetical protein
MHRLMILIAAGMLTACAGGSGGGGGGEGMAISSGVWEKFEEYKAKLTPSSDEYFAASTDGGWASNADKDQAVSACQQHAQETCVVFAHNDEILVPYHVK